MNPVGRAVVLTILGLVAINIAASALVKRLAEEEMQIANARRLADLSEQIERQVEEHIQARRAERAETSNWN